MRINPAADGVDLTAQAAGVHVLASSALVNPRDGSSRDSWPASRPPPVFHRLPNVSSFLGGGLFVVLFVGVLIREFTPRWDRAFT